MKRFIAVLLCLAVPNMTWAATENSYKVEYDGGSLTGIRVGTDLKIVLESSSIKVMKDKSTVIEIPAASVTEISYGQDVHRRVGAAIGIGAVTLGVGALMALTKSKKHFVGLTWADGDKKGGFAMQCDKSDYRGLLTGMEGITGKKVVNSDALTVKN